MDLINFIFLFIEFGKLKLKESKVKRRQNKLIFVFIKMNLRK